MRHLIFRLLPPTKTEGLSNFRQVTTLDFPKCAEAPTMTADWPVAIGTLLLAIVAVFQQWLQRLVVRPRLRLNARVERPDAERTMWNIPSARVDVYYFRLAITNHGNAAAHDVKVYLGSVERLRADKKYEPVERFSPMSLKWSHTGATTRPIL